MISRKLSSAGMRNGCVVPKNHYMQAGFWAGHSSQWTRCGWLVQGAGGSIGAPSSYYTSANNVAPVCLSVWHIRY